MRGWFLLSPLFFSDSDWVSDGGGRGWSRRSRSRLCSRSPVSVLGARMHLYIELINSSIHLSFFIFVFLALVSAPRQERARAREHSTPNAGQDTEDGRWKMEDEFGTPRISHPSSRPFSQAPESPAGMDGAGRSVREQDAYQARPVHRLVSANGGVQRHAHVSSWTRGRRARLPRRCMRRAGQTFVRPGLSCTRCTPHGMRRYGAVGSVCVYQA